MQPLYLVFVASLLLGGGDKPEPVELSIPRQAGLGLRVQAHFVYTDSVTGRVVRDDKGARRHAPSTGDVGKLERLIDMTDHYVDVEGGRVRKLTRHFDQLQVVLGGDGLSTESVEVEPGPLEGQTLELRLGESGQTEVDADSSEVKQLGALDFGLDLGFEGLLPETAVAPGDSWELDGKALASALQLRAGAALYPPQLKAAADENGKAVGRGIGRNLKLAKWELEGTLADESELLDERECLRIDLAGTGLFDLPALDSPKRSRRVRWVHAGFELVGTAWLDAKSHQPVRLDVHVEVEGKNAQVGTTMPEGPFSITTSFAGELGFTATYSQVPAVESDPKL